MSEYMQKWSKPKVVGMAILVACFIWTLATQPLDRTVKEMLQSVLLGFALASPFVVWKLMPSMIGEYYKMKGQIQTQKATHCQPEPTVDQPQWRVEPPQNRRMFGKIVVIVLCAAYILSPIDFIPDFIPMLGWGDDVAAGLIGLRALVK